MLLSEGLTVAGLVGWWKQCLAEWAQQMVKRETKG